MTQTHSRGRLASLLIVSAFAAAACSDFLVADNPGAVEEIDVNNPSYVALLANGPLAAFQDAIDDVTYWNAQFTDEIYNRAVFVEEGQIDRRELYSEMSYIPAFMYNPLQRARYVGEDAARRLRTILGDTASRHLTVARALAYAGHSYIALGEMNCTTPIDLGVPKSSAEIFADAIARFEESIRVADSNKAHLQAQPTPNVNAIAAADSVRYFALVGAARAALNRNDKTAAIGFASQVPAAFVFRAYYSDNTTGQRHRIYDRLQLGSNGTMSNTPFMAKTGDPRLPRVVSATAIDGKPLAPSSYSTYTGTLPGGQFEATMAFRIASGLEARYIVAEAQGPTAATVTFINQRRAAGLQPAVSLVPGADDLAIMAELRDQRSRDFYLDNHRLGDLRRYKEFYNVDLFPQGPYPGSTSGQIYNAAVTCWPLPLSEINGNPNIPK